MREFQRAYLILLCVFCATGTQAQWRGLRVTHLGPEEGVSVRVNKVVQGHDGYTYLASSSGLIRYDGSTFRYFTHDPMDSTSIGPGEIYGILTGTDSLIWLGLRYGGLNTFDPKTEMFQRFPVPTLPYFTIPTAHGLLEDEDSILWVGGHHFQLLKFDRKTQQYVASFAPEWIDPEAHGRRLSISHILQDIHNPDLLWMSVVDYRHPAQEIVGSYGLVSFNKETQTFTSWGNSGLVGYQDSTGSIYGYGQVDYLTRFDPQSGVVTRLPFDTGTGISYLSRGLLPLDDGFWVTTAPAIVKITTDGNDEVLYSHSIKNPLEFRGISRDGTGNIWIGNSPGVSVVNPRNQFIRFFSLDLFDSPYRIFPGRLAYDAAHDMIYLSFPPNENYRRVYTIPLGSANDQTPGYFETAFNVHGLAVDQQGRLLLAGEGKMYVREADERLTEYRQNDFDTLQLPRLWNLRSSASGWVGGISAREFVWFKPGKQGIRQLSVDDLERWKAVDDYPSDFFSFKFSPDKEVGYLVSTVVYRIDLGSGQTTLLPYTRAFNPNVQELTDVVEDLEGYIWLSGVNYLGKFKIENDSLIEVDHFSVRDGMASNESHELHCDHAGRIWVFTSNGINCIDPATREVRYFGINEGLPEIAIDPRQVLEKDDGTMITVNANGIIAFNADSLWNSLSPLSVKVVLKEIRVNGAPIQSDVAPNYLKRIEVPVGRNVVDIQFQGLAYPTDERMQYSYRLDTGNPWIGIGRNKLVTLPDLSPGDYTFQVKAGVPQSNAPVRSLMIHIPTPFYLQGWFIMLAALLLIAAIAGVYRYRINAIRKQEAEKTEVNKRIAELELKALRSQMNPHFMFNSLNSIKDFILHSEPERAAEYLSDFAHLIRLILQNSREKTISLRDELEALQLYVDLERLRFDHAFDFHCIIEDGVQMDSVQIPPMLLQPYIENAIWHGLMHKKEQGNLTLHFEKANGIIRCTVDDDGIGRAKARELKSLSAMRYKSMGMGITRDRIEIMNRMDSLGISVEVVDKMNGEGHAEGTRVVLRIPNG